MRNFWNLLVEPLIALALMERPAPEWELEQETIAS